MSAILEKPFSWANKIIKAVFRGSPNLTTTSDLNRQIDALKKEMFLLRQGNGIVISDLSATCAPPRVTTTGTYVYCGGVRFDIDLSGYHTLTTGNISELRLYAKKTLITYEDDFSKNISGAKFEDGTTQAAADHYVYSDAVVGLITSPTLYAPNSNFEYPNYENDPDYEYVCTLLKAGLATNPTAGYYPTNYFLQVYTIPVGGNPRDSKDVSEQFTLFTLPDVSNVPITLVPSANDGWREATQKLWSRIYGLEKRLFHDTHIPGVNTSYYVNNMPFSNANRRFSATYTTQLELLGTCTMDYNFHTVGNICFVAGLTTFEKFDTSASTYTGDDTPISFPIGTGENEIPPSMAYSYTACALNIQPRPDTVSNGGNGTNSDNVRLKTRGTIDGSAIKFVRIPAAGAKLYWYCVYCFSSRPFWNFSRDDRYGGFNDIR